MKKTPERKKALIDALIKTLGIVTTACNSVNIHRKTFYEWYKEDEEFKKEVDDISNIAIDFVESQLFKRIKSGDTAAIIFFMKTKGKRRGYIEKQEFDHTTKGDKIEASDWYHLSYDQLVDLVEKSKKK